MTNSVNGAPIGILGLGFLGKILAYDFAGDQESWGTWNKNPPPKSALKVFTPQPLKRFKTVDLPDPIPPVNPTIFILTPINSL